MISEILELRSVGVASFEQLWSTICHASHLLLGMLDRL
jgi:hypothetical protein